MNRIKNDVYAEFLTEKEIAGEKSGLSILIKHDYYSSNDNHGKELLANLLDFLASNQIVITNLFIIDSGVKLISDITTTTDIYNIISKSSCIYICSESLDEFKVDIDDKPNIILSDSQLFFEQLILHKPDFIIE